MVQSIHLCPVCSSKKEETSTQEQPTIAEKSHPINLTKAAEAKINRCSASRCAVDANDLGDTVEVADGTQSS